MKIVILAGGFGTRLSEETKTKPKPMVEIGGKPILWHIMKIYSSYGFNEFVICLGYQGHVIKEYFAQYYLRTSDIELDFSQRGNLHILQTHSEAWKITLVDTGENVMTGGRLKRVQPYVGDSPFMLTYGDGVGDVDLLKLRDFHFHHGKLATVTAVQPSGRFGALQIGLDNTVTKFEEKPKGDGNWISGGFFVMNPQVFDYIGGDDTVLEDYPLRQLANDNQLMAYKHTGFWHAMDVLKDKATLEKYWQEGQAPWKKWEQ